MSLLSKLKSKIKGVDPFYEEVRTEQIGLYQRYFQKVLNSIDVETQTAWARGRDYNAQQMARDEERMEKLIALEATAEGLSPAILQVMVSQYFFADEYRRRQDSSNWVKRVLHRQRVDYFPTGYQVRALLERLTH
jgi:hypothetical protein